MRRRRKTNDPYSPNFFFEQWPPKTGLFFFFRTLPQSPVLLSKLPFLFILFLSLFPLNVYAEEVSLQKASDLIRSGQIDAALKILQSASSTKNTQQAHRISFLMGTCYLKQKRWKEAKACFIDLMDKYLSLNDYVEKNIILCDHKLGNHGEAIKRAYGFHSQHSMSRLLPYVRLLVVKSYIAVKDWRNAEILIQKMLKNKEKYNTAEIHGYYYEALLGKGLTKEAYKVLQKIYYYYPNSKEAAGCKAKMKGLRKKNPKLVFPKPEPIMFYKRSLSLANAGRYTSAIKESKLAMSDHKLSRNLRQKHYQVQGRSYRFQKKYLNATNIYKTYLRKFPKGPRASESLYQIARIQWNQGKLNESITTCKKLTAKGAKDKWAVKALRILGGIMENKGEPDKAILYYNEYLKRSPKGKESEKLVWRVAWLNYLKKDYQKAFNLLQKNLKEFGYSSHWGRSLFWAARCAENLNQPKVAAEFFDKLQKTDTFGFYGHLAKRYLAEKKLPLPFKLEAQKAAKPPVQKVSKQVKKKAETPKLSTAASYHLARVRELTAMALNYLTHKELKYVYKEVDKKNLEKVLWLGGLYYKARVYGPLLFLMHNYLIKVPPAKRVELPDEFWRFYYPPAFLDTVRKVCAKYGMDPYFVISLIRQESAYNSWARSSAGAMGLMQLMPKTGKKVYKKLMRGKRFKKGLLYDPELNINLGITHLSKLIQETEGDMVKILIGYNAGRKRIGSWEKRFKDQKGEEFIEMIPFGETKGYVKKVLRNYYNYKWIYQKGKAANENLSLQIKKL